MKKLCRQLFSRLKPLEKAEYTLLLLLAVAVPLHWRVTVVGFVLLLLLSVVKAIVARRVGNPALSKGQRWALVAMLAFFALTLVSGLASENRSYGLEIAFRKLSFLFLPLAALISDTRYLSRLHLRGIFATLFTTLAGTFLVCAVIASVKMIGGSSLSEVLDTHFFPTHHTYVALYISVALSFAYSELLRHLFPSDKVPTLPLWFLLSGVLCLVLFAMAVNSRAGILAVCLLAVMAVVDIALLSRQWRTTLMVFLLLAACGTALYLIEPSNRHRLSSTVKDLNEEYPTDARVDLNAYGMEVIQFDMGGGRWLYGLGEGDYLDHIVTRYAFHGYKGGAKERMNTHNQYLDTFLACGAIGLAILLLMLLQPLFPLKSLFRLLFRRKGDVTARNALPQAADLHIVPLSIFCIMLILATEVMLARQMGITFIAYTYLLLILWKQKTSV